MKRKRPATQMVNSPFKSSTISKEKSHVASALPSASAWQMDKICSTSFIMPTSNTFSFRFGPLGSPLSHWLKCLPWRTPRWSKHCPQEMISDCSLWSPPSGPKREYCISLPSLRRYLLPPTQASWISDPSSRLESFRRETGSCCEK